MVGLGEIMRGEGLQYLQTHFMLPVQRKAMSDIAQCRTAALGTVSNTCDVCEEEYWLFCSCRNRSCPLCQGEAQEQWLRTREEEMLPVPYLHMVFTLPRELKVLARYCPEQIYNALIRSAGQAVIDVGRAKLHLRLGIIVAQVEPLRFRQRRRFRVLCPACMANRIREYERRRPQARNPCRPPPSTSDPACRLPKTRLRARHHAHADGAPCSDPTSVVPRLLCRNILKAERRGQLGRLPPTLSVEQILTKVKSCRWKVYARPSPGGTRGLLEYLAQYRYRVAITNERIVSYEEHDVTFRRRGQSPCTLEGQEFVQRFLLHVPPKGFVRIRSYGFLGNHKRKEKIENARKLIANAEATEPRERFTPLRLCPACAHKRGLRTAHYAPGPVVTPQFDLQLRPPPNEPVAA